MGSLFHMVAREEAFELRLMKDMGYDETLDLAVKKDLK